MQLTREELDLIKSALQYDTQGKWGDGRQEKIDRLIKKIKGAK
jgi:hypothetical protein